MQTTPWTRLLLIAVLAAVGSFGVLRLVEGRGATVLGPPVLSALVVIAIAVAVGAAGWNVRQFTRGKRPGLDPLFAARTVVLATAAGYTGALLSGWYAGHILLVLGDLEFDGRREVAVAAAVALVATVLLAVTGLVVERWCRVPPPEDDERGSPAGSPA
ncbi:DUF3180 domain-containing protein [Actinotalea sp.]|uniref:DUF3180 domain-containing protein n=1 Tax=Actinotalea sp. TaxID=1872145 RepID=UPI0035687955